jgi:hypothetical protein
MRAIASFNKVLLQSFQNISYSVKRLNACDSQTPYYYFNNAQVYKVPVTILQRSATFTVTMKRGK